MEASQAMSVIEVLTIVLSVVALFVTVIGFFASLRFYRDGMMLQSRATDALARIEEKAASIQTQVGGMFDKTLEAALGRTQLNQNFEEVNQQLEETARKIVESALGQIGTAGEAQRKGLKEIIEHEMEVLRRHIERTRESAEGLVVGSAEPGLKGPLLGAEIVDLLRAEDQGLTAKDVAMRLNIHPNLALVMLHSLVARDVVKPVYDKNERRRYKLSSKISPES